MKVQTTETPTQNQVAAVIVHGHVCLVNCPRPFNLSAILPGDRKFCLFHTVWQLEHNAQGNTQNQNANDIVKYNNMQRVDNPSRMTKSRPCHKVSATSTRSTYEVTKQVRMTPVFKYICQLPDFDRPVPC